MSRPILPEVFVVEAVVEVDLEVNSFFFAHKVCEVVTLFAVQCDLSLLFESLRRVARLEVRSSKERHLSFYILFNIYFIHRRLLSLRGTGLPFRIRRVSPLEI